MIAIFQLARKKSWHLSASHLEGVRNVIADSLSRFAPLESEWSLDDKSFQWILSRVRDLQVDLFATEYNHKLKCYVALNLDPQAFATDALSLDWNQWDSIYLFPPINCLLRVLHKLRTFKGKLALIAPNWPKTIGSLFWWNWNSNHARSQIQRFFRQYKQRLYPLHHGQQAS